MTDFFAPDAEVMTDTFIIVGGRSRKMFFTGDAFSFYRARAKSFASQSEAQATLKQIAKKFERPNLRVEKR